MDQVQVMHAAFAKAKDDVYDEAERLRIDRNQIDGRVRGFLEPLWRTPPRPPVPAPEPYARTPRPGRTLLAAAPSKGW